jgi:hypothetical protein
MAEVVDQLRKLKERLESKLAGRYRSSGTRRCRVPIGPFTPNGNAAALGFAQDQRLGPADTAGFKDRETLAFQGVERVSNFCPSQRLIGNLGSSR